MIGGSMYAVCSILIPFAYSLMLNKAYNNRVEAKHTTPMAFMVKVLFMITKPIKNG